MAEHSTLEARLRAALGAGAGASAGAAAGARAAAVGSSRSRTDFDAARASILSGIRQRRARRLRGVGGAVAAAVALGIAVPLVLGSGGGPPGSHASKSAEAFGMPPTSAPPRFGLLVPAAVPGTHTRSTTSSTGRCLVGTAAVTPCGNLVASPRAGQTRATNSSVVKSSATGSTTEYRAAAAPAPTPLQVRVGDLFEVTLPRLTGHRTWSTPKVIDIYHGTGAPLHVRRSARTQVPRAGWQGFVVRAAAAGTFELYARAQALTTAQAQPSGARSRATWTLEVEVSRK
jgi:hypothetical protein